MVFYYSCQVVISAFGLNNPEQKTFQRIKVSLYGDQHFEFFDFSAYYEKKKKIKKKSTLFINTYGKLLQWTYLSPKHFWAGRRCCITANVMTVLPLSLLPVQMESGGTVLSTNWKDVGKRKVEMNPPDDVEFKKYWAPSPTSPPLPSPLPLLFNIISLRSCPSELRQ